MIELDESFTNNDRYLIEEYQKHGTDDFLLTELGDKVMVVPYKYTVGSHTEKTSVGRFMAALLDFETIEEAKYRKAGEPVMKICHEGRDYVVPFGSKGQIAPDELAQACIDRAFGKYNMVINAHRMLTDAGVEKKPAEFSSFMAEVYAGKAAALGKTAVLDKDTPEMMDAVQFLESKQDAVLKHFKTTAKKLARGIKSQIIKAEQKAAGVYVPKSYKRAALAVMLGAAGTMTLGPGMKSCSEEEKKIPEIETVSKKDTSFVDFMGREHSDSLGNIAKIHDLMPEISALLIAVEGYADKTFPDGGGVPTIGSGTTFYLDDQGKEIKVKFGDKTTPKEAMAHKWRFIDKNMLKLLGDNFGKECTAGEAMAGIGAGFCWGVNENGFGGSAFLESMKNGEDVSEQMRKITGFRKQKGLLKRGYVLAMCLSGEWTAEDLLDLPIYKLEGKGFVHCSIYTLDLHDIMECKKDKNGNYLKDADGNDVPVVGEGNFCEYYRGIGKKIKNKLINDAKKSGRAYKTVRDFMPEEFLAKLEKRRGTGASEMSAEASTGKTYDAWVRLAQKGR